jgi:hypothetical protein
MKRNFSEKYKDMIDRSLRLEMLDLEEGCYLTEAKRPMTSSKYRRDFVHTQFDFVTLFCKDY